MAQGLTDMTRGGQPVQGQPTQDQSVQGYRADDILAHQEEAVKSQPLLPLGDGRETGREMGWQCPACRRTYSPLVASCAWCGKEGGSPE